MKLIQPLLVVGFIFALIVYFAFLRSTLRDRIVAALLVVAAVVAVLVPDLTTVAANHLGVGRGSDLLLYLLSIAGVFVFLLIYIRILAIEERLTEVVRHLALAETERSRGGQGGARADKS